MGDKLYLEITDGTTSCLIADGSNGATSYRLKYGGWAPGIAEPLIDNLSGHGAYAPVAEDMVLNIHGASLADAYDKIQILAALLEQAKRFEAGESVAPVLLKYAPAGAVVSSTDSPLQSRIMTGRVNLPPNFHAASPQAVIPGVRVSLTRTGLWLHTTQTGSSSASSNGNVTAIAMSSAANLLSPTNLNLTNFGSRLYYQPAYLALVKQANQIAIFEAADGAGVTDFFSTTDAAANARGNILQFSPGSTIEKWSQTITQTFDSASRRVAVFANVRNNSSTTTFLIRAALFASQVERVTNYAHVPVSFGPSWVSLGVMILPAALNGLQIRCTASYPADRLDIDSVVVVALDSDENAVLAIQVPPAFAPYGPQTLRIEYDELSQVSPEVYVDGGGGSIGHTSFLGSAALLSRAATFYGLLMQTGGYSSANYWRATNNAGAVLSNVFSATRTVAYLTPQ